MVHSAGSGASGGCCDICHGAGLRLEKLGRRIVSDIVETRLSEFIGEVEDADVPPPARDAVVLHWLDCTGVTLAAAKEPAGQILIGIAAEQSHAEGSVVIGSGVRCQPVEAAWSNGSMAHLLDFDDHGFSHPTALLFPTALAVGEMVGASGREIVTAMAIGYEVFERLASSARRYEPHLRGRGYHPTSVYGGPAAAATAGRLLELDVDQQIAAFSIAATQATGLSQQFGTWAKGINAGNSARAGVVAARMAAAGYQADPEGISGTYGLFSAVIGQGNFDFSGLDNDLGTLWAIDEPGLALKPYPACTSNLKAVDAMVSIVESSESYDPDLVREVRVDVHPDIFHTLRHRAPMVGFRGKFSLDYTVACAALDGTLTIESFSDEHATSERFRRMLAKVRVVEHPEWEMSRRRYTPVTVSFADGRSVSHSVDVHRGTKQWPLTRAEVEEKFLLCAGRVLEGDLAKDLLNTLWNLDSEISARALAEMLAVSDETITREGV